MDSYYIEQNLGTILPGPEMVEPKPFVMDVELPSLKTLFDEGDFNSPLTLSTSSSTDRSSPVMNDNKKRNKLLPYQKYRLNQTFELTAYPSTQMRNNLVIELGLEPRAVQIWFQNRRQSLKEKSKQDTIS